MPFKIETITAFVAKGSDEEEGVIGIKFPGSNVMMPLVCADDARIEQMYKEVIQTFPKDSYRVLQFSVRTDITDDVHAKYEPKP